MAFTSGGHATRSDFQPFMGTHPSLDSCLHLANFVREVRFWEMTPLADFILSCDGKCYGLSSDDEFVVYIRARNQPKGGAIRLNLPSGDYSAQWYDPVNGSFLPNMETVKGGEITLQLPETTADVALFIRKR